MKKSIIGLFPLVVILVLLLAGCQKEVSNYSMAVNLNSKTYNGAFTGTIENGAPVDGEGSFTVDAEGSGKYLFYSGEWKDGQIAGKGTLTDENYEIDMQGSGKRQGTFSGEVLNGIPNGKGTFKSQNTSGTKWTYEGEWKNGKMNGQGRTMFEDGKGAVDEGTYTDNIYTPTLVEWVQNFGTRGSDNCQYTLSDAEKTFIQENSALIEGKDLKGLERKIDNSFNIERFKKNANSFSPAFVKIKNASIIQINEYYEEPGQTVTFCLAYTEDYENVLSFYMFGDSGDAVEDTTVDIVLLPIDYTTYKNVSDDEVWALAGVAVKMEVK